jgi:AhpD family alkylhydroperoxidase
MSATVTPAQRPRLAKLAPRAFAALARLAETVDLDRGLYQLLELRASQINGCAFCIDMHWNELRAAGESEQRLYLLDAWRDSPGYSVRERAALALCEAITLIADTHVPDEVWHDAEAVFAPEELAQIVFAVVTINAWNRLTISGRTPLGSYVR